MAHQLEVPKVRDPGWTSRRRPDLDIQCPMTAGWHKPHDTFAYEMFMGGAIHHYCPYHARYVEAKDLPR